jgi:predicted ATPase
LNGKEDRQLAALLETVRRQGSERTVEISLGTLTRQEQLAVVRSIVGPVELSPGDLEWLERCSQGRPYYLRELIELVRDDGILKRVGNVWKLERVSDDPIVPPTLSRNIRDRLLRLLEGDELAREAVHFGACAGTVFDTQVIAEALGVPARKIGDRLQIVERGTGLLARDGQSTRFAFDHDLTREAVLEDLGEFRKEIHTKLAVALAARPDAFADQVAYQYGAAGNHATAAAWYLRVADKRLNESLFDVAQRCADPLCQRE